MINYSYINILDHKQCRSPPPQSSHQIYATAFTNVGKTFPGKRLRGNVLLTFVNVWNQLQN